MGEIDSRCALALTAALFSLAAASAGQDAGVVDWRCEDVVVIGRVETIAYTDMSGPDDILGHGRFDMRIRVKRNLRGGETPPTLAVSRIAHGQLRQDLDFLLVLTPGADDAPYVLQSAAVWGARPRPKLADRCSAGALD